jgi:hypothetical protein
MRPTTLLCFVALARSAAAEPADAGALPSAAVAPAPSADEIKRVLDYQEHGREAGPVLLDLVACLKVDQAAGSPTHAQCVEAVTGPVKKGTQVYAWLQFFCPRGGKYDDLKLQYVFEGEVRRTIDLEVEGLSRTRTWRAETLGKPGRWQLRVLRGSTELAQAVVQVN